MMGLTVSPRFPFTFRIVAPRKRADFGTAAPQVRRQYQVPYYEFEVSLKFQFAEDAIKFAHFATFMQGDKPFWFDGGPYGDIKSPVFIDYGTGTRIDFFAPRRNLLAPSWVLYVNNAVVPVFVVEASGWLIFNSPPALNAIITGKGRNLFKVLFDYDDRVLQAIDMLLGGALETNSFRLLEVA